MGYLDKVTSGVKHSPIITLVYGVDGIGKSTFAAEAPAPLFLGAEHGTDRLQVTRLPGADTLSQVREMIAEVAKDGSKKYKTFVIDTLDWLEPMIWAEVCMERKVKSITQVGFNKGYEASVEKTRGIISQLDDVKAAGMHVILLAHSKVRTFQDPAATSGYDRYQLAMREDVANVWRQYADSVLFCNYVVYKENDDTRRAQGSGERVMFTEERPAYQAKNRFNLPHQISMKRGEMWKKYYDLCTGQAIVPVADLLAEIETLKQNITDVVLSAKVEKSIEDAKGDVVKLGVIKTKLTALANGGAR